MRGNPGKLERGFEEAFIHRPALQVVVAGLVAVVVVDCVVRFIAGFVFSSVYPPGIYFLPFDKVLVVERPELIPLLQMVEVNGPLQGIFQLCDERRTGPVGRHRLPERGLYLALYHMGLGDDRPFYMLDILGIAQVEDVVFVEGGLVDQMVQPFFQILGQEHVGLAHLKIPGLKDRRGPLKQLLHRYRGDTVPGKQTPQHLPRLHSCLQGLKRIQRKTVFDCGYHYR